MVLPARPALHVDYRGPRSGRPVLFIHGFPLSGEIWAHAAGLLEDRCHCIIPDLPGHGRSEPMPAAEAPTLAAYADLCAGVMSDAAPRPGVVCGLSMGGMIALEFFRRHRGLVGALVLCGTRATPETPEGVTTREQRARLALEHGAAGVRQIADAMIQNVLAPDAEDEVRRAVHAIMAGTSPAGLAAASRAMGMRPDLRPVLARIDVPTLMVVGEEDSITPPESMVQMQRITPGSRLAEIPGAGHIPPLERPDDFGAVLGAFVDRL